MSDIRDDWELVAQAQQGDQNAFAALVTRYQQPVVHFCLRMTGCREDAEDLAQESFVRLHRHLKRLKPRANAKFSTALFGVARNLTLNHLRDSKRRGRDKATRLDERHSVGTDVRNPLHEAHLSEMEQALKEAITQLKPEHREILVLREYNGLDYQAIAQVLGCRVGTVRSRLARARDQMRELLLEQEGGFSIMRNRRRKLEELSAYLDGEAHAPDRIARELETDEELRGLFEDLKAVRLRLQEAAQPEISPAFLTRVMAATDNKVGFRPVRWVPVFGTVLAVLGIVLFSVLRQPGEDDTQVASQEKWALNESALLVELEYHFEAGEEIILSFEDPYLVFADESTSVNALVDVLAERTLLAESDADDDGVSVFGMIDELSETEALLFSELIREYQDNV